MTGPTHPFHGQSQNCVNRRLAILRRMRRGARWYAKENSDLNALAAGGYVRICGETSSSFYYELTAMGRKKAGLR